MPTVVLRIGYVERWVLAAHGTAAETADIPAAKEELSRHCRSWTAFGGRLHVVLDTGAARAVEEARLPGPRLSSLVGAYGAVRSRRQTLFLRLILCGRGERVVRVPVRAEVEGPAWSAVGEDMVPAHDGDGGQGGDGSGVVGVPGAGQSTDYETDTATASVDVVRAVVGAAVLAVGVVM